MRTNASAVGGLIATTWTGWCNTYKCEWGQGDSIDKGTFYLPQNRVRFVASEAPGHKVVDTDCIINVAVR